MSEPISFDSILSDLFTKENKPIKSRSRRAVTIWVSPEDKARYDRLQRESRRRFSKKAKQALLALIQMAENRAS